MQILQADLIVPGWCSFRVPHGTNVHPTFSVPPPSTLYGLVANALGLAQDDVSYRAKMNFGVQILAKGELVETYTQWMKWNPHKNQYRMLVTKQKLLFPAYRMFVTAEKTLLHWMEEKLNSPERILYLGESDDVVELKNIEVQEWQEGSSTSIQTIIPVDVVDQQIPMNEFEQVYLPVRYEQTGRDQYHTIQKLFYVNDRLEFKRPVSCFTNDVNQCIVLEGCPC